MPEKRAEASSEEFRRVLASFEEEVLAPIVPGEGGSWCRDAHGMLEPLRDIWRRNQDNHREILEQILDDDPELAGRVSRLEARDGVLVARFEALGKRLDELAELDASHGTDSWEPIEECQALREELEAWIVDAREQELELRTWMIEALYRDRGTGD